MAEDTQYSAGAGEVEAQASQLPSEPASVEPKSGRSSKRGRYKPVPVNAERKRRRIRRIANFMIIGSVLALVAVVLYFVGTWLYSAHEQKVLREQLAAENPGLVIAVQNVEPTDFISAETAAARAAEAERLEELARLKEAAIAFGLENRGHTGRAIGEITIPVIGVDNIMVEGAAEGLPETYLRKGPGHWPETPFPGQGGSVVVSGHRTTYGAPFFKLNELKPGDEVQLAMPYAVVKYKVTQVIIVKPTDVQVVADQGKEMLSLVACHPLHSSKQRIIAQCDFSSFVLLEDEQ